MKRLQKLNTMFLSAVLFLTLSGLAQAASSTEHQRYITGEVVAYNQSAKSFTVQNAVGKSMTIAVAQDTKVKDGELAVGERVRVSTREHAGRRVATAITIRQVKAA